MFSQKTTTNEASDGYVNRQTSRLMVKLSWLNLVAHRGRIFRPATTRVHENLEPKLSVGDIYLFIYLFKSTAQDHLKAFH